MIRRVCVLRPSRMARIVCATHHIPFDFTAEGSQALPSGGTEWSRNSKAALHTCRALGGARAGMSGSEQEHHDVKDIES